MAGRIVGGADDDGLGLRTERGAQAVEVQRLAGGHRDEHGTRVAQDRVGAVVLVERLEHDDFVAGIDDAQERRRHRFGRAAGHGDLRVRIDGEVVPLLVFRGQGVAEARGAPGDGVLIDVVADGASGGLFQDLRAGEVRKSLREVDGSVLGRETGHPANHGFGEAVGAARGADLGHGLL